MRYKDILIHVDYWFLCQDRVDVTIDLASRFESSLTGLYAPSQPFYQPNVEGSLPMAETTKREFLKRVADVGIKASWNEQELAYQGAKVSDVVVHFACYSDLVVIAQPQPGAAHPPMSMGLPEQLVLGSGRPVLIVPYVGRFQQVGERILVAWQPGPRATRALSDAMPFLKRAKVVHLVSILAPGNFSQEMELLDQHLTRHGVKAKFDQLPQGALSTVDILINMSVDVGADLIVMGAHAQQRGGQTTFGPVGKSMIDHMTIPVLMSH